MTRCFGSMEEEGCCLEEEFRKEDKALSMIELGIGN